MALKIIGVTVVSLPFVVPSIVFGYNEARYRWSCWKNDQAIVCSTRTDVVDNRRDRHSFHAMLYQNNGLVPVIDNSDNPLRRTIVTKNPKIFDEEAHFKQSERSFEWSITMGTGTLKPWQVNELAQMTQRCVVHPIVGSAAIARKLKHT